VSGRSGGSRFAENSSESQRAAPVHGCLSCKQMAGVLSAKDLPNPRTVGCRPGRVQPRRQGRQGGPAGPPASVIRRRCVGLVPSVSPQAVHPCDRRSRRCGSARPLSAASFDNQRQGRCFGTNPQLGWPGLLPPPICPGLAAQQASHLGPAKLSQPCGIEYSTPPGLTGQVWSAGNRPTLLDKLPVGSEFPCEVSTTPR